MSFAKPVLLAALLALASGVLANPNATSAAEPPIRKHDGHLVDAKGRGLYLWDGDVKGNSSQCNSQCRLLWPPLFADDKAVPKGPFNIIKRDDGRLQWALNGKPLYRWASDKKFGDAGGDGVAGTWHLVKVAPSKKAAQ